MATRGRFCALLTAGTSTVVCCNVGARRMTTTVAAVATLAARHPGLEISLTDTHPPEALELLRTGKIEVAVIFRYDETDPEPPGVRLHHLLDDQVFVLSLRRERSLAGGVIAPEPFEALGQRGGVAWRVEPVGGDGLLQTAGRRSGRADRRRLRRPSMLMPRGGTGVGPACRPGSSAPA